MHSARKKNFTGNNSPKIKQYQTCGRIRPYYQRVASLMGFDFRNLWLTVINYFRIYSLALYGRNGKGVMMIKKAEADRELDTYETARFLKKERSTLATWRSTKQYNLKWLKRHGRIYYKLSELMKFKEDQTKHF